MKYSSSREYGPYPQTKDVTVSALGKAKGKTFHAERQNNQSKRFR